MTSRRPHRTFVLLLALAAMLAVPGVAAAGLVLGRHDVPGLKGRSATAAGARKALQSALVPAGLPRLPAKRVEVARFAHPAAELWSAAFVLRSPRAAKKALRAAALSARRQHLVRIRVGVGEAGWLLRRRKGSARPAVVLWRRDAVLSAIVLRARRGPGSLRDLAVRYARIVDARQARLLSETAVERVFDRIGPNGAFPRRAALDLFALGYGPLPGTRRPSGRTGRLFDGTVAEQAILRVWPTLTKAQQAAALHALGLKGVDLRRRRRSSRPRPSSRSPLLAGARADYGDPTFKRNAFLEKLAMKWVALYEQKLNRRLRFQVVAGTTSEVRPRWLMAALPIEPDGTLSENATICRIRQFPLGNTMSPVLREWVMGHEVFHCFQGDIMGPLEEKAAPGWLIEGGATWAAAALDPVPFDLTFGPGGRLREYFETCAVRPLFAREYDGAGFFGHAQDVLGDIWPRMKLMLRAPNDLERYALLGGDRPELLDTWGSSVLLLRDFGFAWTSRRPIEPPDDARCPQSPLWLKDNGVKAEPFTVAPYVIQAGDAPPDSPLVRVVIDEGSARLGDGRLDTMMLDDEWFCLAEKCVCPEGQEGTPPPAVPLRSPAYLALTGGRKGADGTVFFESLDSYCKEKAPPPPPPPPGGGPPAECGPTGCGASNGDPHMTTFDKYYYDFQAAGEYVLVRSRTGDLEVQARQEPYPGSKFVSINTAIAMRVGRSRVGIYRGLPPRVRVNGQPTVLGGKPLQLPGGGRIELLPDAIEVYWPDGSLARVWPAGPWGLVVLVKPAAGRRGKLTGLLGNWDGKDANDLVTRRGRKINLVGVPPNASYRLLYHRFGDSWRVTRRASLFDYAPGQSTSGFTIQSFPARSYSVRDLPPAARRRAEKACRRRGITNPEILRGCILDFGITREPGFVSASKVLQRTSRPTAPRRGGAKTRWTAISTGGQSNSVVASVALDGGKVVAAYLTGTGAAEAATFTPSVAADAAGLRRDPITSGWASLADPLLLPRTGGGLQALVSGLNAAQPALNGTSFEQRNPDGTFGPPVLATGASSAGASSALLAPDGVPLWAGAYAGGLYLARGATGATVADLGGLRPRGVLSYWPALGRDAAGRYWLAWYALGGSTSPRGANGLYMVQVDPVSLRPLGAPRRAPGSANPAISLRLPLPCARACRLVYVQPGRIVSWAYGEKKAVQIRRTRGATLGVQLTAAYTASGRLWTALWNPDARRVEATLGNEAGAGGTTVPLARPTTLVRFPGGLSAVTVGEELVLVVNWLGSGKDFVRYANVVPPE